MYICTYCIYVYYDDGGAFEFTLPDSRAATLSKFDCVVIKYTVLLEESSLNFGRMFITHTHTHIE